MKDKKIKKEKTQKEKKPHYKKHQSGIYNKKKPSAKTKGKQVELAVEQLIMEAQQAEQTAELEQEPAAFAAPEAVEEIVAPAAFEAVEESEQPAMQ
ncbi:MAG: hypothetical protein J6V39_08910, partial [Clostridia bacterium]|nr:hypothetical protein [Clostridia bacterium]